MSPYQKLLIGGIGALCLSILKLINANFYLGSTNSAAVYGAYLTYLGYIILGTVVGFIFCEEQEDVQKTRKSAFLMGLLAPSILLAIIAQPISLKDTDAGKTTQPPSLGSIIDIFATPVRAQTAQPADVSTTPKLRYVEQKDLAAGFEAGVRSALGLQTLPRDHVAFVVGKTKDQAIAKKTAMDINALLAKSDSTNAMKVTILKPDANESYYVTIGDFVSPSMAALIDRSIKETALKVLAAPSTPEDKATARILGKGDVYKGATIFNK